MNLLDFLKIQAIELTRKGLNMGKKFYLSKTFWVNVIAIVGMVAVGKEFDAETVAMILGGINLVLRLITKDPIVW